jgi:hypothetical protein
MKDVDEVNVEPIDLGHELWEGSSFASHVRQSSFFARYCRRNRRSEAKL